jgi:uncharacterized protein (DUF2164 family)
MNLTFETRPISGPPMSKIELDKPTLEMLSKVLARHLKTELDVEVEPFDALDLLRFLAETLGPHFYNQGLRDAQALIKDRAESIVDAIYDLEKPLRS